MGFPRHFDVSWALGIQIDNRTDKKYEVLLGRYSLNLT